MSILSKIKKYKAGLVFWLITLLTAAFAFFIVPPFFAGLDPEKYPLTFHEAASPVAENLNDFHTLVLIIATAITFFVLALLLYVILRFNSKANPEPAQFSHNTLIEVVWTVIPVIILIIIIIPSMKLLFFMDRTTEPDMTLKVIGYQWYWGYEYPDHDDLTFNAYMVPEAETDVAAGQKRLLSTDNPVVLPVDTNVQLLVTAADVLHSFAMPAFGVKIDAVPGRINESWVRITKPGVYYGQCSELCGKGHAYMPIEIHAVSKEAFAAWVATAATDLEAAYQQLPPFETMTALETVDAEDAASTTTNP